MVTIYDFHTCPHFGTKKHLKDVIGGHDLIYKGSVIILTKVYFKNVLYLHVSSSLVKFWMSKEICLILKSQNLNFSWNTQKLNNFVTPKPSSPRSLLIFRLWDEANICWKCSVDMLPKYIMCSCLVKDGYIVRKLSRILMMTERSYIVTRKMFLI